MKLFIVIKIIVTAVFAFLLVQNVLANEASTTNENALHSASNEETSAVEQDQLQNKTNNNKRPSKFSKFANRSQEGISSRLYGLSRSLDRFFSNPEFEEENNESRMSMQFVGVFEDTAEPELRPRLRISLVLPETEKRLKLILTSEEDDDQNELGTRKKRITSSITSAIRYVFKETLSVNVQSEAGLRLRAPIESYVRLRGRKNNTIGKYGLRFTETLQWFNSEGASATTRFDVERSYSEKYFARYSVSLRYWDIDEYFEAKQGMSLFRTLENNKVVVYGLSMRAIDKPSTHITEYLADIRFRKRVYDQWIYLGIVPGIVFRDEDNFKARGRLELVFEAIFGDIN